MQVNLNLSDSDIKKIFGKYEGSLIYNENKHLIFSSRSMLGSLFVQLPFELREEIIKKYPRVMEALKLGRNVIT